MNETDNQLRIDLEYNRPPGKPGEERLTTEELSLYYIDIAVANVHQTGLEGQMRRVYARIQRKLDEAKEKGTGYIALEEAEKTFLRKVFEKCAIPSQLSKYFVIMEDEIDRVTDPKKAAPPVD